MNNMLYDQNAFIITFIGLSLINLNESMTKFVSLFIDNFTLSISLVLWLIVTER